MYLQFFEKAIKMNIDMKTPVNKNKEILHQEIVEKDIPIPVRMRGATSGVLAVPEKGKKHTAIIVAHGAGNDMNTPLITSFCRGVASSGYPVLRFNFLYAEYGKKAPDKQEVLAETWESAYQHAKEELGDMADTWVAAGKSMGGRVASQMVADNLLPVHGLIFLGYPLHPPDNKEKLRDAHLYMITIPMLFFSGTRDQLCNIEKLGIVLKNINAPWDLFTIDGGDHSFHVPKSTGRTEEEIYSQVIHKTVGWLTARR